MSTTIETTRTVHVFKSKYTKKDGQRTWSYRFEKPYRRENGKRTFVTKSGFTTKKDAQKAGQAEFDRVYKKVSPAPRKTDDRIANLCFEDYINHYWIPYQSQLVKDTTMHGYRKRFNNILFPKFGKTALKDITIEVLEKFFNEELYKKSAYSNHTLLNLRALMRQVLRFAVKNEHLAYNPMELTTPHNPRLQPDVVKRSQSRNAIDRDTMNKIYERYPKGTNENLALKLLELTGMRLGEAFGLDWKDISFENHCIFLVRQIQRRTPEFTPSERESELMGKHPLLKEFKWYISNPKHESRRAIPMTIELEKLLRDEWECQQANRNKYGNKYKKYYYTRRGEGKTYTDFQSFNICTSQINGEIVEEFENGILNEIGVGYEFNPVLRRADGTYYNSGNTQYISRKVHGYEGSELISASFNIHSLRHTYASRMRSQGFDDYIVQGLMGHKNPSTTTRVYMHLEEDKFAQVTKEINTVRDFSAFVDSLSEEERNELMNRLTTTTV
jgi:integrase